MGGTGPSVSERARRLGTIIRFTRYLRAEDGRREVPPAIFGAERSTRPTPYILTAEQIRIAKGERPLLCGAKKPSK
jgi:SLT domain-containing protein